MKNTTCLALILALMLITLPAAVSAQGASCIPTRFLGTATVNGNPAPTGLGIEAYIDGELMGSTITVDGEYGYSPYEFNVKDNDGNCENTATIEFFIEGQPAGTGTLKTDQEQHFVFLDLSATGVRYCGDGSCNSGETCSSCAKDCGSCSTGDDNGGGGGGGGGGSGGGTTTIVCTPDWECSGWSQCVDGMQERTCIDVDECDTEEGKPAEEQECGLEALLPDDCDEGETTCVGSDIFQCDANSNWHDVETCEFGCEAGACLEESESQEEGSPLTGMFLDPATGLGVLIVIIIIIAGYLLLRRRGSKK